MIRVQWLENLKTLLTVALAAVVLVVGAMASAKAPESTQNSDNRALSELMAKWAIREAQELPKFQVQVTNASYNPTYTLTFPNGETFLVPIKKLPLKSLTPAQIEKAAEDTRVILEASARMLAVRGDYSVAEVYGGRVSMLTPDANWLAQNKLVSFDPIRAAYDDSILKAPQVDVLPGVAGGESKTAKQRFMAVFAFIADAVWGSTIRALWTQQILWNRNKNAKEFGIQLVFRGEIQFGIGSINVMKTLPIVLSIGYDPEQRSVVFRRGIRKERMDGGTAFSLAAKMEIKAYRLSAVEIDKGDSRPGFGTLRGESWLPPSLPMVSFVADSAHGFRSAGISLGLNVADIIPGSYLMNTVNRFEETQRVAYSSPLPDPAEWMRKFHKQVEESAAIFESAVTRGGRCELLFKPVRRHS